MIENMETDSELERVEQQRMRWRSRRGLLELDLLLLPFIDQAFYQLSYSQLLNYRDLLEQEDQDILAWLQRHVEPPADFREIIDQIARWHEARP